VADPGTLNKVVSTGRAILLVAGCCGGRVMPAHPPAIRRRWGAFPEAIGEPGAKYQYLSLVAFSQ